MFKWLKKKINNYLSRLSKANEEAFGNQRLSCCNPEKSATKKKQL